MSENSEAFDDEKGEMLEDEEMPTFISVSSKDVSLPYNADANIQLLPIDTSADPLTPGLHNQAVVNDREAPSPTTEERDEEPNDENEGSVYVLSSGDDNDPSSRSDDEDLDDEEDIDDEDDEDIDDMDEVEAEEEEVGEVEDGQLLGDFSEDENERVDVMSDDTAMRSGEPVAIIGQKRSQSLQDLSSDYRALPRRWSSITGGNKYNRVQSKVRRYIQDLKEKNRRSAENRLRAIEDARRNEEFEAKVREEEGEETEEEGASEDPISRGGRRSLKNYAEQALKDLEISEECSQEEDNDLTEEEEDRCAIIPKNNSVDAKIECQDQQQSDYHRDRKIRSEIHRPKRPAMNGQLVDETLRNVKIPKGIVIEYTSNGQTQGQNILDVRSIGYDEYMRGSLNSGAEKTLQTKNNLFSDVAAAPKLEARNKVSDTGSDIEITKAEGVDESPMEVVEHHAEVETILAPENNEKMPKEALAEIAMMQTQINQKATQCKEIREAYEKTLSENFELKQEVEDLKKALSKLTAKKPAPQVVAVAIQTDPPPELQRPVQTKDIPATENLVHPKLSTSSMGSAISANEHWTESAGSLPMSNGSIRPLPNLTPLSNAEDSFIGVSNSPPKTKQLSHAFQTSSRIIKMLSNLTQRKSKAENMISTINGDESGPNLFGKGLATPGVSSFNSPLNNPRGSNKRKASEMPENTSFLQPPKIPHTASGSQRLHRRSRTEFKYPGDYIKINSQAFPHQSNNDVTRNSDTLEDSRREDEPTEDLDSGVKCFTYRDDENSMERSFLIQAEDETKYQESLKDGDRAPLGVVRECGPYLLGNVEVRMTEINGTINIWGKEVNQESTVVEDEPEEEANIEDELTERGAQSYCHKTPNPRNHSCGPMSCSTNKKPKIPPLRLSDSGYFKNYHSPSTSTLDNLRERHNLRSSDQNDGNCHSCDQHCGNSRSYNKFKRLSNFGEEDHPKLLLSKSNCRCHNWEHENCDYTAACGIVSRHCHGDHDCTPNPRGTGRCSRVNSFKDNEQSKTEENFCRNQSLRFTPTHFNEEHVTCRHGVRKNSDLEDDDVFKRPSTSNQRVNDGCSRTDTCRSCSPSLNQSNDPLISHHPHEPPETRRRRSSGKRVRGILMDFLRGCGDCRVTNGPDNKVSPSVTPQIRIRSSTPPPTLLNQSQQRTTNYGSTNNRCAHTECCSTCSRRIEMAAEIETQLEIFGAEMERLRSRSQAVLGMLNTLHAADAN